jgi:hypothetical protein
MLLENLDPTDRDAAQGELEQLADVLRADGLNVEAAPLDGPLHADIREGAGRVALDVLNVVLAAGEIARIAEAVEALLRWARRRRHFRDDDEGEAYAVIWGPNYEVLKRVRLPERQEGEDG